MCVLQLDEVDLSLPYMVDPRFVIKLVGKRVVFESVSGLEVSWDGNHASAIKVPEVYKNQVCGLCGNMDGTADNDYVTKDGQVLTKKEQTQIGDSWVVPGVAQNEG